MAKPLFIAKQSGHRQGWFGHIVALVMAQETTNANRIALRQLDVQDGDNVLEVGFGPADDALAAARLPTSVYTLHSIGEKKSALLRAAFGNVTVACTELRKGSIAWAICN